MRKLFTQIVSFLLMGILVVSCSQSSEKEIVERTGKQSAKESAGKIYETFKLTTDLSKLSEAEKKMIPIFIQVGQIMDKLFWKQAYGDKTELLGSIKDGATRRYAEINYGAWDRLGGDSSFINEINEKPLGAQFYPTDMTKDEFNNSDIKDKKSLYTNIRRDTDGSLISVPYHEEYKEELTQASQLLKQAAEIAEDPGLKKYLNLKAEALLSSEYRDSDLAWMDMKDNGIDIITGPTETYEDKLFGYKSSFTTYVLVKDKEWSKRLAKYASMLPELQEGLPVDAQYKKALPGTGSQLNAYDVIYYAGDCNAGSKTIAVNLPNDETVQKTKGSRRSQLKNAMQAKFEKILVPISKVLIDESQRKHITFNAFFGNTMFHEVAHGLGIKETINGKGTVRQALKDKASALEEGKADILGLYMVTKLFEKGEITDGVLMDNYVTFLAGIFRSVRFGASSAHGKANMLRFNYFQEKGAFSRDEKTGTYKVNFNKMQEAMNSLSALIITLQGNGDYEGVDKLMKEKGMIGEALQNDLDRLSKEGIAVDIVFEQGLSALGLQ